MGSFHNHRRDQLFLSGCFPCPENDYNALPSDQRLSIGQSPDHILSVRSDSIPFHHLFLSCCLGNCTCKRSRHSSVRVSHPPKHHNLWPEQPCSECVQSSNH